MAKAAETKKDLTVKNEQTEQLAMSERFTEKVLKEFGGNVSGAMQVTDYQRTLGKRTEDEESISQYDFNQDEMGIYFPD